MFRKLRIQNLWTRAINVYRNSLLFCMSAIFVVACNQTPNVQTVPNSNCRMIEHAVGKTCVPLNPKRLVTLGVPSMADAIALGIKPIGTILYFDKENLPPYLEGKLEGIELVGTSEQPNLEKIVILKPDLIIGLQYSGESIYPQLSQIAPTVLGEWQGYPSWKQHFNFVAEVLGKTKEAKQIWARYGQRIQKLRAAIGDHYQDLEVSFVHICCGTVDIDLKNSFSGTILEDIGLRRPPSQDFVSEDGLILLSEERLPDIDGDIIFVAATVGESEQLLAELKRKPLWNNLKAVQQERVYPVSYANWRGGNPLAADAVIDDLFKYLVKETAIETLSTSSR